MQQEFKNGDALVHCHYPNKVTFIGKIDPTTSAILNGTSLQMVYTNNLSYPKKERWVNVVRNDADGYEWCMGTFHDSEASAIAWFNEAQRARRMSRCERIATKKIEY